MDEENLFERTDFINVSDIKRIATLKGYTFNEDDYKDSKLTLE
jgi:hypothetical protein